MASSSWLMAAPSAELQRNPLAATVEGIALVLFRDEAGRARALPDRCPHRNVPLSMGRCRQGRLACAYHGWEFDGDGTCRLIPSNVTPVSPRRMLAPVETEERDGFVWVRLAADPGQEP